MKIVEFMGCPGSGKTTLVNAILKQNNNFMSLDKATLTGLNTELDLKKRIVCAFLTSLGLRSKRVAHFINPSLHQQASGQYQPFLQYALDIIAALETTAADRYWLLRRVSQHVTNDYLLQKIPFNNDIVIADEHFCQTVLSLFGTRQFKGEKDGINLYAAYIPVPDVIVSVQTSPAVALQRCKARSRGVPDVMAGLSDAECLMLFQKALDVQLVFCDFMSGRGAKIIKLANDGTESAALDVMRYEFAGLESQQ